MSDFKNNELKRMLENAWLDIDVDEDKIFNPLLDIPESCQDNPELYIIWLMSKPEYFYYTCKALFKVNILPFQSVILQNMWNHKFPMLIGSRGMSKSFMLAIYILLRLLFMENRKIVIAGAGFRQSKVVFQYIETIVNNSPLLREYLKNGGKECFKRGTDEWRVDIGSSNAIAIPIGVGDKIRGKRANDIICDEFASIMVDIFETVIAGFGAVSSAPELNVKRKAAEKLAKRMGISMEELDAFIEPTGAMDNQIILSGTAYYDFNHFAKYHDRWRKIIKSKGNNEKLALSLGVEVDKHMNWRDYSVIRIPYELIPEGFMDDAQISRSRSTMHSGNFEMEFGAVFSKDSAGFFKKTLVDSCVVYEDMLVTMMDGTKYTGDTLMFEPKMYGDKNKTYVMGVDPALAQDNFAIVILELDGHFRKVVHCWVTNKLDHDEKIKMGLTKEHNYYAYAARKIRELNRTFPCVRIAIDAEGGGRSIMESLKDKDKLNPGELPIYHFIDPTNPHIDEDGETGLHLIDEIKFADSTWVSNANHGMRKDMEDKLLLFPFVDSVSYAMATYEDEEANRYFDTLEQCVRDIEELKNELVTIMVTETKTGKESFDCPEVKVASGKKGKMKKDRYSALLMANMTAREMLANPEVDMTMPMGGFSRLGNGTNDMSGKLFTGPSSIAQKLSDLYR